MCLEISNFLIEFTKITSAGDFVFGFFIGLIVSFVMLRFNLKQANLRNSQLRGDIELLRRERDAYRLEFFKQANINFIGEVFKK